MGKIVAIDFGKKRCGIAETDELQLIAAGLTTVETHELIPFLKKFCAGNDVSEFVVGLPLRQSGEVSEIEIEIQEFIEKIRNQFPEIEVFRQNESYSSQEAVAAMVLGGMKKKNRREKANIDKISATIILQRYLEEKRKLKGFR